MSPDRAGEPDPGLDIPLEALLEGLRRRWPLPARTDLREQLLAAWTAPGRGYHDARHLTEVLDRLDELAACGRFDRITVQLAAWFHDAVHEGRPDDEAESAAWASRALAPESVDTAGTVDVAEVERLVLLTRDHAPDPNDLNGTALCDADLAILAAPPERYAAYVTGVRREYAHVPDDAFVVGRAAVLRSFLQRAHVFSTAYARGRWEATARDNATRELAALESSGLSARGASAVADRRDAAG